VEKYTSKISYRKCSQISKMASRHGMDSASAGEQFCAAVSSGEGDPLQILLQMRYGFP